MKVLQLQLREAVITRMRDFASLTNLVPQASIFGEVVPADHDWPFTRYGSPVSDAFYMQGLDGANNEMVIHAFAKGESMDVVSPINDAIVECLHDASLELDSGWCLDISFVQCQTIRDPNEAWHGINRFTALTGDQN